MTYVGTQTGSVKEIDALVTELVDDFNDLEINKLVSHFLLILTIIKLQDQYSSMDMTCHIFIHLIDNGDTTNARFVWKRASDKIKKESKALDTAWNVAKAIKHGEFG